jgi:hypothetical protein
MFMCWKSIQALLGEQAIYDWYAHLSHGSFLPSSSQYVPVWYIIGCHIRVHSKLMFSSLACISAPLNIIQTWLIVDTNPYGLVIFLAVGQSRYVLWINLNMILQIAETLFGYIIINSSFPSMGTVA